MILKKIAEGRTAEVFSFDRGKVVKLYRLGFHSENLHREAEKCDVAFRQGLPTPQVVDLIQLNGRQGIIFEECIGSTMGERLQNHPNDVVPMAELLAELHIRIHKCSGKGLPSTPKEVEFFVKLKTTFLKAYQAKYLELRPLSEQAIALWTPVMAGARLSENAISGSSKKNLVALINVGRKYYQRWVILLQRNVSSSSDHSLSQRPNSLSS